MIKNILSAVILLWGVSLQLKAQEFFNLTADEVRIDSLLPVFSHTWPVEGGRAEDYTVEIEYPEFVEMTRSDILRYLQADSLQKRHLVGDSLPALPYVHKQMSIDRKHHVLEVYFSPVVFREGKYRKMVSFKLAVTRSDKRLAGELTGEEDRRKMAEHSILASGEWAKISVAGTGVHQLTEAVVRQAGFTDLSRVRIFGYGGALQPEVLSADYILRMDDLMEVPQCVVGGKHLFYGQGSVSWDGDTRVRNPYSVLGYYFITEGEPLLVDSATFVGTFYPAPEDSHTLYEVDNYAWFHGGRNLYDQTLIESGQPQTYSMDAAAAGGKGELQVVLTADASSKADVSVNGEVLGTVSVGAPRTYSVANTGTATFAVPELKASNKIEIAKVSGGNIRLDYMVLTSTEGKRPAPALSATAFPAAQFVYRITNQDLHAHEPVDMVIIIPTTQKLLKQAERLKQIHEEHDGMSVRIVPADEIYNEFSSGTPDATAYKRYMRMLYEKATTEESLPKYLVLFGDGAWDNRMLTSDWASFTPDDFLLCYESENSFDEVQCYVTDDFFCLLDDEERVSTPGNDYSYRGKADVAVGRFPVRNESEAKAMVDKIEAYITNKYAGSWQNTLVFLGDDGNNNIHMDAANQAAKIVEQAYPAYEVKRVFWDAYNMVSSSTGNSYPDVESILKGYLSTGALLMDYSGHGNTYCLSHEMVLKLADFKNAKSNHLPLWITASCDIMPFDGSVETIGEVAVTSAQGGAIAFFGTTRTVYASENTRINNAYIRKVIDVSGGGMGMGEAARQAKNSLVDTQTELSVNKLQYTYLGDPALKLACPRLQLVVDSINGEDLSKVGRLTMKAGSEVSIVGHVEQDGQRVSDYSGVLSAAVRDVAETVVCQLNNTSADGASKAYQFTDRANYLYKGNDSIRAGRFAFSFAVPKDIRYSSGTGMVNLYGMSAGNGRPAHGMTEDLVFNGTGSLGLDSIGPSIYCYLNSTAFVNGDAVNATPYFVAEVQDEDGINASGSGIGHDLQLIIDGRQQWTYNLNSSFSYSFGSYKEGTVGFSIPELPEGDHKLVFRAWDILNNCSTAELSFRVVRGLSARILDVYCTQNPASSSTAFRITHDRIGSEIEVIIDVFDMSGRHLWSSGQTTVPEQGVLEIPWDLCISGGRPLDTGVYLYRVRVSSDGSGYTSNAKKFIVLRNN